MSWFRFVSRFGVGISVAIIAAMGCAAESAVTTPGQSGNGAIKGGSSTSSSGGIRASSSGGKSGGVAITDAGTDNTATTEEESWPPSKCKKVITLSIDAGEGAYCQGPAFTASASGGSSDKSATVENANDCGKTLWGVARDFVGFDKPASTNPPGTPHPDFGGKYCCGNPKGTVLSDLGTDGKPVYNGANITGDYNAGGVGLTGKEFFDQWYRDTPGVNLSFLVGFNLVPSRDGKTSVFSAKYYFPVDDQSYGSDAYGEDGKSHAFGFTTELHTKFKYQGGETFAFEGDDDLWVFINGRLAIDLGGIHSLMTSQIALDEKASELGIEIGNVYSMDLFNAERHPSGSHFKMTTSMTFVDCGINPIIY